MQYLNLYLANKEEKGQKLRVCGSIQTLSVQKQWFSGVESDLESGLLSKYLLDWVPGICDEKQRATVIAS